MQFTKDMHSFQVRNGDVEIKFTCPNYGKRIGECMRNLQIDGNEKNEHKLIAFFGSEDTGVEFRFGPSGEWIAPNPEIRQQAFLFENTDYPVRALSRRGSEVKMLRLVIGKEANDHVIAEDEMIFGTVNFRNQVGHTDIRVVYLAGGEERSLAFSTEVLSYKMDYRSDMRQVIRDIEEEFSMLSYSLLKQTYLTFREKGSETSDLIWWQIFRDCYRGIADAADHIINRPKRRLKSEVRYERAERLPYIPPELENEYSEFGDHPAHLYRIEEMYLSRDTVENRFLKYAIQSIASRFKTVQRNVLAILNADNIDMRNQLDEMNGELERLCLHPFFRGIGTFKGFTQDSLVMKQAYGYKDVYEKWILLQCGYELQEGIMQLEVKEISELYEIWCFIKIKNIVQHILKGMAEARTSGKQMDADFIKKLIQGKSSDIRFVERDTEVELASVMYNATTDDETAGDIDPDKRKTDIADTTSPTTEQRPDIVLRLSKNDLNDVMVYTYLFDAKYRLNDKPIRGHDVPPVDAINQLHRYRDAIYYTQSADQQLKREVIGGYVLYPGNLNAEEFINSYYHKSIKDVNIGAFPLKPGGHWHSVGDDLLLSDDSSEDVLYKQIRDWLLARNSKDRLQASSLPQKGLNYTVEDVKESLFFMSEIDTSVNASEDVILAGKANKYLSGSVGPQSSINLQNIRYFAPMNGEQVVMGYYDVKAVKIADLGNRHSKPLRVELELGRYRSLARPMRFDESETKRGITKTRAQFLEAVES